MPAVSFNIERLEGRRKWRIFHRTSPKVWQGPSRWWAHGLTQYPPPPTKWTPFRKRHFKCIFFNKYEFRLQFHWTLLIRVQLTIFPLCFTSLRRTGGDKPLPEPMLAKLTVNCPPYYYKGKPTHQREVVYSFIITCINFGWKYSYSVKLTPINHRKYSPKLFLVM